MQSRKKTDWAWWCMPLILAEAVGYLAYMTEFQASQELSSEEGKKILPVACYVEKYHFGYARNVCTTWLALGRWSPRGFRVQGQPRLQKAISKCGKVGYCS